MPTARSVDGSGTAVMVGRDDTFADSGVRD